MSRSKVLLVSSAHMCAGLHAVAMHKLSKDYSIEMVNTHQVLSTPSGLVTRLSTEMMILPAPIKSMEGLTLQQINDAKKHKWYHHYYCDNNNKISTHSIPTLTKQHTYLKLPRDTRRNAWKNSI